MARSTTIGGYLVTRLEQMGLRHIFGVPGDYVLSFYDQLEASKLKVIGTCTEIGAGYAADAYARVNGLGAVCVTYCVGGLNVLNAIAGACAEKSPLIVISGSPGLSERDRTPLLHHCVRDFDTQQKIYKHVTVASIELNDPETAGDLIDDAIRQCVWNKQPVYIELPRDMATCKCDAPGPLRIKKPSSEAEPLAEAVAEASHMLWTAKKPVILAGVEMHRFGLQESLVELVDRTGFPVAATLLGKSVISERHGRYLGVYEGAIGHENVRRQVEQADCVLILGAFMTDINLGIHTARLDTHRTIYAHSRRVAIKHHHYDDVFLGDFVEALTASPVGRKHPKPAELTDAPKPFRPQRNKTISVRRFFARMDDYLKDNTIVVCDVGDCLFAAADLTIHRSTEFLCPAYYTSMGFAIPAAVGSQIRNRRLRPIVFVGDGAFQMTGQELSTIAKYGLNPIIFVLNNKGYTTERFIHEGPYNNIHNWAYHRCPEVMNAGWGAEVRTEGELEEALITAEANAKSFSIINVHLDAMDCSAALLRLGKRLGKKVR
ncbi:MAG: thiamine pyrophosphate-binding protein [Phycisphaerae bacterium]|nr:thiamine pyrophosphate-binding protein [Phycisphaerae bacterium]